MRTSGHLSLASLAVLAFVGTTFAQNRIPDTDPQSVGFYRGYPSVSCAVSNTAENDEAISNYFIRTPAAPGLTLDYAVAGNPVDQLENTYSMPFELTVIARVAEPGVTRILNCEGEVRTADAIIQAGQPYRIVFDHEGVKRVIITHTTPDGRMNFAILKLNLQGPVSMREDASILLKEALPSLDWFERSIVSRYLRLYGDQIYDLLDSVGSFAELEFKYPGMEDFIEGSHPEALAGDLKGRFLQAVSHHTPVLDYRIESGSTYVEVRPRDALYRSVEVVGSPANLRIDTSRVRDDLHDPVRFFWALFAGANMKEPLASRISSPGFWQDIRIEKPGEYVLLTGAACNRNGLALRRTNIKVVPEDWLRAFH